MKNALNEFIIEGVKTTIPFHKRILEDIYFLKGDIHINFIEERIGDVLPRQELSDEEIAAAVAVLANQLEKGSVRAVTPRRKSTIVSSWKLASRVKRLRRIL